MSKLSIRCTVFFLSCLMGSSVGLALDDVPLDPLTLVKQVEGECFAAKPGSTQLVAVVEGRAYHFGSDFRTGLSGSMALMFSAANVCKIEPNSVVTPIDVARNNRALKLHKGKIEVSVEEGFDKTITVETPGSIVCNARKGAFAVEREPAMDAGEIVTVGCSEGESQFSLTGPHFKVDEMKRDDSLKIQSSADLSFVRLTNLKGSFAITIKDAEGNPKIVETKSGQSLKIWSAKLSGGKRAVRVLITTEEGSLITNEAGELDESQAVIDFIDSE